MKIGSLLAFCSREVDVGKEVKKKTLMMLLLFQKIVNKLKDSVEEKKMVNLYLLKIYQMQENTQTRENFPFLKIVIQMKTNVIHALRYLLRRLTGSFISRNIKDLRKELWCAHCYYKSERNSDIFKHIKRRHRFEGDLDTINLVNLQVQDSLKFQFEDVVVVRDIAQVSTHVALDHQTCSALDQHTQIT